MDNSKPAAGARVAWAEHREQDHKGLWMLQRGESKVTEKHRGTVPRTRRPQSPARLPARSVKGSGFSAGFVGIGIEEHGQDSDKFPPWGRQEDAACVGHLLFCFVGFFSLCMFSL